MGKRKIYAAKAVTAIATITAVAVGCTERVHVTKMAKDETHTYTQNVYSYSLFAQIHV